MAFSSQLWTIQMFYFDWLVGLGVWFSLRVREVPGSIPGRAQFNQNCLIDQWQAIKNCIYFVSKFIRNTVIWLHEHILLFNRAKIFIFHFNQLVYRSRPSKNIVIVFDCPPPRKSLVKGERFIRVYEGRPDIYSTSVSKQFIGARRQTLLKYFRKYQCLVFKIECVINWAFKHACR